MIKARRVMEVVGLLKFIVELPLEEVEVCFLISP